MGEPLPEAELQQWMERLGPQLIGLAYSICRDRVAAEDVTQEAFVKLWRRPPDGGPRAIPSWMKRVVTNASINVLQRTRRHGKLPEVEFDPALRAGDHPAAQAERHDEMRLVSMAMDRLPDEKRVLLILRAQQELSYAEIAETLGIPEGTVMSRLNRARKQLRKELDALRDTPSRHAADIEPMTGARPGQGEQE
jgi:RNA polymerase sigma-70 factor (ECF subfamily)